MVKHNLIGKEGTIIDATIVEVPIQHNNKDENEQIKNGKIPEHWQGKQNKTKLSQKDCDARWTKKHKCSYYGYKDHIKVDKKSKLILKASVTAANVHDSKELKNLVEKEDERLYADSAYIGEEIERILKMKGIEGQICERGARGRALTKKQKVSNRKKIKNTGESRTCIWVYDKFNERYLCKNDRISSCNILDNNDELNIQLMQILLSKEIK